MRFHSMLSLSMKKMLYFHQQVAEENEKKLSPLFLMNVNALFDGGESDQNYHFIEINHFCSE